MAVACGGDDEDFDAPDGPEGEGSMEQMTPTQSKVHIQEVTTDFMDKFDPADQKEAITLFNDFGALYGDLDLPLNFQGETKQYAPGKFFRTLAKGLSGKDVVALSRAASSIVYNIKFQAATGIYEPGKESWTKVQNSDNIVFRFNDKSGHRAEMIITGKGATNDLSFDFNDEDGYWDYDLQQWITEEYVYTYNISIPREITVKVSVGGNTLVDGRVNSTVNVKGHNFDINADMTVANIRVTATTTGNDSKVTESSEVYVSGEKLATTSATVNGNDLCNIEKIYQAMEEADSDDYDDDDDYSSMLTVSDFIKNGSAKVSLMDQLQIYAQGNLNKEMEMLMDSYWDSYEYDGNKNAAKRDCEKAANVFNNNIHAQVRFNNTATDQATITFRAGLYEETYYNYWEYYVEPLLYFPKDGTTYSFEDYFSGFNSLETIFNNLVNRYALAFGK